MILVTIVLGIIGLGIVVFVHELGHFIMAKLNGITVEAFSLGWGKPIYAFTYKETEYRIGSLPIGGYCKMKGEELFKKALDEKRDSIPEEKGSLFSVAVWRRMLTYLAGPLFNFIFAVLVLTLIWYIGFSINTYTNRIVLVSDYPSVFNGETTYPSDRAGLESGDRIIAIDGRNVETYADIRQIVARSPRESLPITIERDGRTIDSTITPRLDKERGIGKIGISAWVEPVVDKTAKNGSAAVAGLQTGDRIIEVEDREVEHYLDIYAALAEKPQSADVTFLRNGDRRTVELIPEYNENGDPNLGLNFSGITHRSPRIGPFTAVAKGTGEAVRTITLTVKGIALLFSGVDVQNTVSGPIRITYMVGEVASQGFSRGIGSGFITMFRFLSLLSVALCFGNLLPIPALDGGLILLSIVEIVKGTSVSPKTFYRYQTVGFFIIILILFFTTFGDISYLFSN
jgi:regulator of sigma E protease